MLSITRYVIRHNPTGHYLPQALGRSGRGGSHVEPIPMDGTDNPRLLHSERAAKAYLASWLMGKVYCSRGGSSSFYEDEPYEDLHLEHVPTRRGEEMEIVPITIELP